MFCKNASIFDLAGRQLVWDDVGPDDVKAMHGVYYILSEHTSFWSPIDKDVKGWTLKGDDPPSKSACRQFLPDFEPIRITIESVKAYAIARVVDGKIQSSKLLFNRNYQPTIIFTSPGELVTDE
jgi:hypothetical protein